MKLPTMVLSAAALVALTTPVLGQEAAFVVMFGKDTVAVEKYTRTATRMTGELASRFGAAGNRLSYEVTLGSNGRPVSVVSRPPHRRPRRQSAARSAAHLRGRFGQTGGGVCRQHQRANAGGGARCPLRVSRVWAGRWRSLI